VRPSRASLSLSPKVKLGMLNELLQGLVDKAPRHLGPIPAPYPAGGELVEETHRLARERNPDGLAFGRVLALRHNCG
jgi:hypothetical protein